jgi:hypothetical protein
MHCRARFFLRRTDNETAAAGHRRRSSAGKIATGGMDRFTLKKQGCSALANRKI